MFFFSFLDLKVGLTETFGTCPSILERVDAF